MKKTISTIIISILVMSLPVSKPTSISAKDGISIKPTSSAIELSWDAVSGASFYQIARVSPKKDLFPKPVAQNRWVDESPSADTPNTYEIKVLSTSGQVVSTLPEVTASVDPNTPTLSKPCHVVLSFAIGSKSYTENGAIKTMAVAPLSRDGRTYIVIKHVVEPLFGTIGWEAKTKKVTIEALGKKIEMWVGKPVAKIDGKNTPIDPKNSKVAPFIEGGRTYVPLRFPVESFGRGKIDWYQKTKTAVLVFPVGSGKWAEGTVKSGSVSFDKTTLKVEGIKDGSCVGIQYENLPGSKVVVGRYAQVPCTTKGCEGNEVSGTVDKVDGSNVVVSGQSFRLSSGLSAPSSDSCIRACVVQGAIVSYKLSVCPGKGYEGQIQLVRCQDGLISVNALGTTVTVRLPQGFDCTSLSAGQCIRFDGRPDPSDQTQINATVVEVIQCRVGQEMVLFTQGTCSGGQIEVQDISGNSFTLKVPEDVPCGDIQPGECLKVFAKKEGNMLVASEANIVQPPKDEKFYRLAFVTSVSPLKVTVPGGNTFTLVLPKYFKTQLKIFDGLDIWGAVSGSTIKSPRVVSVSNAGKYLKGEIVGVVCEKRSVLVNEISSKTTVVLSDLANCESIQFGECYSFFGVQTEKEFLACTLEKTECPKGCQGETYEGTIVEKDCQAGTAKIRTPAGDYLSVKLPQGFDCSSLKKGLCLEICGNLDGNVITAQKISFRDCREPVCTGKLVEGLIVSTSCKDGTFRFATKNGELQLQMPETQECEDVPVGSCVQVCIVGESKTYYIKTIPCSKFGSVLEGTIIQSAKDSYTVQTKEGNEIQLLWKEGLSLGDCIVALGNYLPDSTTQFRADIVAKTTCGGVENISGSVTLVDCAKKTIEVATESGTQEINLPEDADCKTFLPGDCVFVRHKDGKTLINKVDCPQTKRAHFAMFVIGNDKETVYGTDLATLDRFECVGQKPPVAGSVVIVQGHQVSSRKVLQATFTPYDIGCVQTKPVSGKLISYREETRAGTIEDVFGNSYVMVFPGDRTFAVGDYLSLKVQVYDTGLGTRCMIATELYKSSEGGIAQANVTGVIFAIDPVEGAALLHVSSGENIAVMPSDPETLKIVRVGDCANAVGRYKKGAMIVEKATLTVSDCLGGTLGRNFTGVIVGVNSTEKTIDVYSDKGGVYEVTVESVSMLTGLSLGNCVAVSGILMDETETRLLGKTIARIDCKQGGFEPISIEGRIVLLDTSSKQAQIESIDGMKWTAYLERPDLCTGLKVGTTVRCCGKLQAKQGIIAKAYLKKAILPTSRWSVIGKITESGNGTFKLEDSTGRTWEVKPDNGLPAIGQRVLCVGNVPPDGLSAIDHATWTDIGSWQEPKTSIIGTVFGVSCGMDKLLIRDDLLMMHSLRLPHAGFCGSFTIGECISVLGRVLANIPNLTKVAEVKPSTGKCNIQTVTGWAIARSTKERYGIIQGFDGSTYRLGFDTELMTGKFSIGSLYKAKGRFLSTSPDTLKVEQIDSVSQPVYQTVGRIVYIDGSDFYLQESSGRILKVKAPVGVSPWTAWLSQSFSVAGKFEEGGAFLAESVNPIDTERVAVELEGEVVTASDIEVIVKSKQGGIWRAEGSFGAKAGDSVYVVGTADSNRWWTIASARLTVVRGDAPTSQIMSWGIVDSTECENNRLKIKLDDGTIYEVYPEDLGVCEGFTQGERVQFSGVISHDRGRTVQGGKLARSGLSGATKTIVGIITEVSCTSRVIKMREEFAQGGGQGPIWTIGLAKDAECEKLKTGDRISVTGDPVPSQQYQLEDCKVIVIGEEIKELKITGKLHTLNCASNVMIIESDGKLYRVFPSQESRCSDLFSGDTIEVTAKVSIFRKYVLNDATWKKIYDKDAFKILQGKVDTATCPGIRFMDSTGEYWKVNIREDQPCDLLDNGMEITLKGVLDLSQDHLMHKAEILDLMRPKVIYGTIDDISCSEGKLVVVDKANSYWEVVMETSFGDCITNKFSKGDMIQVSGFQNMLYKDSPIYFGKVEGFGNETGMIPMDFIGEVLNTDCGKGNIQVRSGHTTWIVTIPDGFDCNSLKLGDWVRVEGGREDWSKKICFGNKIEVTTATMIGFISEANYAKNELTVVEIKKPEMKWTVSLADTSKLTSYKKGMFIKISGTVNPPNTRRITGASVVATFTQIKGKVIMVDHNKQLIKVTGTDLKEYTCYVKTDWVNLEDYKLDQNIIVTGNITQSKDKTAEMKECLLEDNNPFFNMRRVLKKLATR